MQGMSPGLTDLDLLSALVGVGMPPLVAVVVSSRWQPWQRGVAAAAMCIAAGVATTWIAGDLTGVTPVRAVLVVAAATFGSYRRFWHTTGITKKIEDLTTPRRRNRRKPTKRADPKIERVPAGPPQRPPWQSPPPGAEWLG